MSQHLVDYLMVDLPEVWNLIDRVMVMKKIFNNQKGNIALFTLGMLSIMMILFILVINLSSALATKEKSETTVTQASLAATSAFYESIGKVIKDYGESLDPPVEPSEPDPEADDYAEVLEQYREDLLLYQQKLIEYEFFTRFEQNVEGLADTLEGRPAYNGWSRNEVLLEAVDQIINNTLMDTSELFIIVRASLFSKLGSNSVKHAAISTAIKTIEHEKNGGVIENAELEIKDHKIYIRAANEIEAISYNGILEDVEDKVYQESAGPKIDFLHLIWAPTIVKLDEYP